MKNAINPLFRLIQSAFICKRSISKHLKLEVGSSTYKLAKYYEAQFSSLEKCRTLSIADLEKQICFIDAQLIKNKESHEAQRLLSTILSFFEALKPFVMENHV